MNNCKFDLGELDNFNNLESKKKNKIMCYFNLNKYKLVLNELKNIYKIIDNKDYKDKIKQKITSLFSEGCLNINIINSNHTCNIYIGCIYYLYLNTNSKEYNLYILKKKKLDCEEFIGKFKLNDDLIWKNVFITSI